LNKTDYHPIKIEKISIIMNIYQDYIQEIEERKTQGLHPKPIDSAELLSEIIAQIKDTANEYRADSLKFFIYNTLPGTTSAAGVKAKFLKEIILKQFCYWKRLK
jgi:aconitate hydratase 2/2-methylisocitrate dehydratase